MEGLEPSLLGGGSVLPRTPSRRSQSIESNCSDAEGSIGKRRSISKIILRLQSMTASEMRREEGFGSNMSASALLGAMEGVVRDATTGGTPLWDPPPMGPPCGGPPEANPGPRLTIPGPSRQSLHAA